MCFNFFNLIIIIIIIIFFLFTVNVVEEMKKSFNTLQAWTGDPCLPNNTIWEWLGCNVDDPPRIKAM